MVEENFTSSFSSNVVTDPQPPILTSHVESEENLCNITKTIPVNILVKLGVSEKIQIGQNSFPSDVELYTMLFKEFQDVFAWTYEEISGIDPSIVIHQIKTHLGATPVHQKLCQVHP